MTFFEQVAFGTPTYRETLAFREDHLRRPLGLQQTAADVAGEDVQFHFAALDGGVLCAVLCLKPLEPGRIKLRQMCVDAERRGAGLGSDLVRFAEAWARGRGFTTIELHARLVARPFYERLGYRTVGEMFEEVGLPHVAMEKTLANESGPSAA